MSTFLVVIHCVVCVFLVLLVLVQSGKGAEVSASFGGSSQTVFGSGGGANFFTKLTAAFATVFMVTSVLLTMQSGESSKSVFDANTAPPPAQTQETAPQNEAEKPKEESAKDASTPKK